MALAAGTESLAVVVGGEPLDIGEENSARQPRHLRWNFVASRQADIDAATAAWQVGDEARFPAVPGESDRIPWPD